MAVMKFDDIDIDQFENASDKAAAPYPLMQNRARRENNPIENSRAALHEPACSAWSGYDGRQIFRNE